MFFTADELKEKFKNKDFQKHIDTLASQYKNKKVILYGAGVFAELLLDNYDFSKLNIIKIADSKFSKNESRFKNFQTISPDIISELNPDVIILTTYDDKKIKSFFKQYYPEITRLPIKHIIPKTFIEKLKSLF